MESPQDTARVCAWSGEESTGKHYVLTTTEGTELVSEDALRAAPADTAQQLAHLTAAVNKLSRRVAELEGDDDDQADDAPAAKAPRAAAVPRQRKG